MKALNKYYLVLAALIMQFCGSGLQAQDYGVPTLNDHGFIINSMSKNPFIVTTFSNSLGGAKSIATDFPILDLGNGEVLGLDGSILFLELEFRYRQKLKEWIAFEASFDVGGRVGTDVLSVLAQGLVTVSIYELGWILKLHRGEKHMLSGMLGLKNASGSFVNFRSFAEDIIEGDTTAKLTQRAMLTTGGGSLVSAYAISPTVGLNTEASIHYGESFQENELYVQYDFSSSLEFNFNNRYNVPLGALIGFKATTLPDVVYVNEGPATMGFYKLAYTGSKDFLVGIEGYFGVVPVNFAEKNLTITGLQINSQYFFR